MSGDYAKGCWIAGGVLGLFVLLFTWVIGETGFFGGVFLALIACVMFARFLIWSWQGSLADSFPAAVVPQPRTAKPQVEKPEAAKPVAPKPAEVELVANVPVAKAEPVNIPTPQPVGNTAPDNLKMIKGVGPKFEGWLHDHGITRFAQIAGWSEAEIDRHAEELGARGGRIRADDWVGQARVLAAAEGGE